MPLSENTIELRSPGAQEIFGKTPHWLLPWSNTLLLIFVCVLFLLSYIIKYPDIVSSKITITTKTPPINFMSKFNGNIRLLRAKDSQVKVNDFIGYIETGAKIEDIQYLFNHIGQWQKILASNNHDALLKIDFPKNLQITQLESHYSKFLYDLEKYRIFMSGNEDNLTLSSLNSRINQYQELNTHLKRQQSISEADLILSRKKTDIDSILWVQKVIPYVEFNNATTRHNQILYNLESSQSNYISNLIQIQQLNEQLKQITIKREDNQRVYRVEIINDLSILRQELAQYIHQYMFVSPFNGTLSFPRPVYENQYVTINQPVFDVIPNGRKIYGTIALEMQGSGKVVKGQSVNIKLSNFPYHEFGYLKGKITGIEITPNENTYTATVELTNGLVTTYNRKLPFSFQMTGTAEIITNDLRLIERFFNQFRNINQ